MTIFINDVEIVTLVCTPSGQEHLALGFLRSEGFMGSMDDVESWRFNSGTSQIWITLRGIDIEKEMIDKKRLVTSGCARGISFYSYDDALKSIEIRKKPLLDPVGL